MVTRIANIRSKREGTLRTIFFRVRTDESGFKGKIKIKIADISLPDQDADIAGKDSVLFSLNHSQTGKKMVEVSAGGATSAVRLNLDAPSDP